MKVDPSDPKTFPHHCALVWARRDGHWYRAMFMAVVPGTQYFSCARFNESEVLSISRYDEVHTMEGKCPGIATEESNILKW